MPLYILYNLSEVHILTILDAIIQGIVQGLTEFLPVSSSGHLALVQYFTGNGGDVGAFFSILLHAGTLVAIIIAFYPTILKLIAEGIKFLGQLFTGKFRYKTATPYQRMLIMLLIATLPLFVLVLFKDFIQKIGSDNSILAEGFFFLFTSWVLFLSCKCRKGKKTAAKMNPRDAVAIGIMQGFALFPGVSRSGSTISMGLIAGLDRSFSVEFSFILGIPAVLGAIILEIGDVIKNPVDIDTGVIITGFITSVIFGIIAIKTVNWLVKKDKFKYFAWYTLVLGIFVVSIGIVEIITHGAVQQFFLNMIN